MRPSMPPRSCFAQKVTMPPRSADASTYAALPSTRIPGFTVGRCSTTHGSSPSTINTFVPPPRKRCGTFSFASTAITSGMDSYRPSKISSVVPPIPSDVFSVSETPWRNSAPSSFKRAAAVSLIRMARCRNPRIEQHGQFFGHAADASCANGHHRVARTRLAQHKFDATLQCAREDHVLVTRRADRFGQPLAGDAVNRSLACGVDIGDHDDVRLIERALKILPEILRARIAVRLEKHQQALEPAAARSFERGANLRGMMPVVVNQRHA